jgi:cysteine sulfinate desulfinase/cysteine desulfurase-like protein
LRRESVCRSSRSAGIRGVAFSTGSACHGGGGDGQEAPTKKHGNPVLAAIGLDALAAPEVVRLSFSGMTTRAEAEQAAQVLAEEATRMLDSAPRDRRGANAS